MEDNTVKNNEIEEVEFDGEVEEASGGSNGGAFVAGIVGGFLAYAAISGAKKLRTLIIEKLAEKKHQEAAKGNAVDVEFEEVSGEQSGSEKSPEQK